jgi:hypothetical protein
MSVAGLSLLTLNIGNPSVTRARRQLAWLIRRDEQVLVLTEAKASAGCRLLAEEFIPPAPLPPHGGDRVTRSRQAGN